MQKNCFSQHAVVIHSGRAILYAKHTGYLYTTLGDKIKGLFKYDDEEFPGFNVKRYNAEGIFINNVKMKSLDKIILCGKDTSWNQLDSTYFKKFYLRNKLFRQLTYGEIRIFDDLFSVDENPGRFGKNFIMEIGGKTYYLNSPGELAKKLNDCNHKFHFNKNDSTKEILTALNG